MPHGRVLSSLFFTLFVLCTAIDALDPFASPESEEAVRAEFAQICRALKESNEPYYGEGRARELQRQLGAGLHEPPEEALVRGLLGVELVKLGKAEEAIEEYTRAVKIVQKNNPKAVAHFKLLVGLGMAHMRVAEDKNCVLNHTAAMCIFPIRPEAVHQQPEHSRQASEAFLAALRQQPDNLHVRWLLNLARLTSGDYPQGVPEPWRLPSDVFSSKVSFPRWRDRAPELGVNAFDLAGGAIMDDFDNDGLLDLITSTADHCGSLKAYRNNGRGGFEDVAEVWGLSSQFGGLNLVHADFDNDGWLDLLVLRGGWMHDYGRIRKSLLRNELGGPSGRFVDVTRAAGLAEPAYPTQTAAWADYDGDGDLDLYIGNEATATNPFPSQLFRNNGDGTFTDITFKAGVANLRYAKAVVWGDYDNDGDPDLYVSNLTRDRLYRNNGEGTFTDVALELGVSEPEGRSFTSWFFDFDNDGDLDLFVSDYGAPTWAVSGSYFGFEYRSGQPLLYRNDGARFTEVSRVMGLTRPTLPMGANYGDLDNDGWLDFYLGTGDPGFETLIPNLMYRNDGGQRFVDVTLAGGFGHLQKGHGVAFGDLDNDGDQDLLHQLGGFYPGDAYYNALFENPGSRNHWVTLRLEGKEANRFGVGARIEIRARTPQGLRSIHLVAGSGGSFGGSSTQQEVGLGGATLIEELVVRWPGSGTVQRVRRIAVNQVYRIIEGESKLVRVELPRIQLGLASKNPSRSAGSHRHIPNRRD